MRSFERVNLASNPSWFSSSTTARAADTLVASGVLLTSTPVSNFSIGDAVVGSVVSRIVMTYGEGGTIRHSALRSASAISEENENASISLDRKSHDASCWRN